MLDSPQRKPIALVSLKLDSPWHDSLLQALQKSGFEVRNCNYEDLSSKDRERTDIAIIDGDLTPALLGAGALRWIHCGHAGLDRYLPKTAFRAERQITSAAGRSAPALAEHALFMMMQLSYSDSELRHYRHLRTWQAPPVERRRSLNDRRLGIVGMGHIGSCLADYATALGMRVSGWRKNRKPFPPSVQNGFVKDEGADFEEFLSNCEFLVLACSLTDESQRMVGANELETMPKGSFLINIARAGLVDQQSVISALDSGHLAGFGTDVHEPEPLPFTSPLWSHPRVVMSPHNTPRLASRDERHYDLVKANLDRFLDGRPLLNSLCSDDSFSPSSNSKRVTILERLTWRLWRLRASLSRNPYA